LPLSPTFKRRESAFFAMTPRKYIDRGNQCR
jgi:hypothetical protein